MPEKTPHEPAMTVNDARRRLDDLRDKERRGELTVHDAGEITKLLVFLGEEKMHGKKAA